MSDKLYELMDWPEIEAVVYSDVYKRQVGSYAAGTMTEDDVEEFENKVCPTCGSCSGMYTAISMNCLTEVLGMGCLLYTSPHQASEQL